MDKIKILDNCLNMFEKNRANSLFFFSSEQLSVNFPSIELIKHRVNGYEQYSIFMLTPISKGTYLEISNKKIYKEISNFFSTSSEHKITTNEQSTELLHQIKKFLLNNKNFYLPEKIQEFCSDCHPVVQEIIKECRFFKSILKI